MSSADLGALIGVASTTVTSLLVLLQRDELVEKHQIYRVKNASVWRRIK